MIAKVGATVALDEVVLVIVFTLEELPEETELLELDFEEETELLVEETLDKVDFVLLWDELGAEDEVIELLVELVEDLDVEVELFEVEVEIVLPVELLLVDVLEDFVDVDDFELDVLEDFVEVDEIELDELEVALIDVVDTVDEVEPRLFGSVVVVGAELLVTVVYGGRLTECL